MRIISVKAEICGIDVEEVFADNSGDEGSETSCIASGRGLSSDRSFPASCDLLVGVGVLDPSSVSDRARFGGGVLLKTELLSESANEASSAVCSRRPEVEY